MSKLRIVVIQLSPCEDATANLTRAGGILVKAAARGARLAVLPEMFGGVRPSAKWRENAEPPGGPTEKFLSGLAAGLGIYIVGGSYIESAPDGRFYNTCPVLAPDGSLLGRYRKMHLFWTDIPGRTVYDERECLSPGAERLVFDAEGFKIAVGICYDLRFPEFFRKPRGETIDIYCLGAAFMEATGKAHWEVLVRARAVENLAFFVAAATIGRHYEIENRPGEAVTTYGHSMIVSPWGEVLAVKRKGEGGILFDVTREAIDEARARLAALDHMRSDLCPPQG